MSSSTFPARSIDHDSAQQLLETPEGPVNQGERLPTLDVMRGVALLGILAVNVEDFAGPESRYEIPIGLAKPAFVRWHAHLDLIILTLKWMFVAGKMRAMFAMLFGAGTVLLTERIERRGQPVRAADIYLRRNMWLALFGLIHGTLIWNGDILLEYGLTGLLFLFPLRHVAAHKLVIIGLTVWVVGGTLGLMNVYHAGTAMREGHQLLAAEHAQAAGRVLTKEQQTVLAASADAKKKEPAAIAQAVQEGRQGYLASIFGRTTAFLAFDARIFTSGFFTEVLGAMIAGMGLYKLGFLSGRWSSQSYLITMIIGYAMSTPIILIGLWHAQQLGFTKAATLQWMALPFCFETIPGTLANASVLLFLIRKGWLGFVLDRLGAVGRTAFSNYILTSLICQFVFAWGPWKLYGRLEYYQYLFVVAAVWAINLAVSFAWLQFFAMGPMEWVWRSLTYWRLQPLRPCQTRPAWVAPAGDGERRRGR